jgi:hypothetical protein
MKENFSFDCQMEPFKEERRSDIHSKMHRYISEEGKSGFPTGTAQLSVQGR